LEVLFKATQQYKLNKETKDKTNEMKAEEKGGMDDIDGRMFILQKAKGRKVLYMRWTDG